VRDSKEESLAEGVGEGFLGFFSSAGDGFFDFAVDLSPVAEDFPFKFLGFPVTGGVASFFPAGSEGARPLFDNSRDFPIPEALRSLTKADAAEDRATEGERDRRALLLDLVAELKLSSALAFRLLFTLVTFEGSDAFEAVLEVADAASSVFDRLASEKRSPVDSLLAFRFPIAEFADFGGALSLMWVLLVAEMGV